MTFLLELRGKIYRIIGKREKIVLAAVKFVIALLLFLTISEMVGYMEKLQNPFLLLILACLCAFTPIAVTLLAGAALIVGNFYALAPELSIIAFLVFLLMFCLYFRFARGSGIYAVLTTILSVVGIPYVLPNSVRILTKPYKVLSVICGTIVYFLMKNVRQNEALFRSFSETSVGNTKYTLALNQIFVNQEMFLYAIAFISAAIVVYYVRKMRADHAWGASIITGTVVQLVIVGGGEIALGSATKLVTVFIGCMVSLIISAGVLFMIRSLDYSRVERVQFEDDEYYYYVKAVPKASVTQEDKKVKQITSRRKKDSRKSNREKRLGQQYMHHRNVDDAKTKKTKTAVASEAEKQRELEKKAMEEFDVDGDWLE